MSCFKQKKKTYKYQNLLIMSFPTNWCINKYYNKTETEEHWNLKKAFLLAHMEKYPEEKLVSLATTFYNMEFLGCQYHKDLMNLVENLANQVEAIVDYRIKKKNRHQRYFVKASDAVKKTSRTENKKGERKNIIFVPQADCSKNSAAASNYQQTNSMTSRIVEPINEKPKNMSNKEFRKFKKEELIKKHRLNYTIKNIDDKLLYEKAKNQLGVLGKLVLYEKNDLNIKSFSKIDISSKKCNLELKLEKETDPSKHKYSLLIENELISEYTVDPLLTDIQNKCKKVPNFVRDELANRALEYLKKYCFTIIEKETRECQQISTDFISSVSKTHESSLALPMDGIGAKMMKQMGWNGQGLGKNSSGIVEPIQAEIRLQRRGFGALNEKFRKEIRNYLEDYLKKGETKRLLFTSDFTKEDRAYVHQLVGTMGSLKSKSIGKSNDRHLTVERKLSMWNIVEQLLSCGGENDNYSLRKPECL